MLSNPQQAKNNQLQALGESEKNEHSELKLVYNDMCKNPNKKYTCHDINRLLNSGTNIASRIFRKLEINGMIKYSGDIVAPETNKTITSYQVIDQNKVFEITTNELPRVEKDDMDLAVKYMASISKLLIQKPLDIADRKKVLAMLITCTDKISRGQGKELSYNLFVEGFVQDTCFNLLKYTYTFIKNKIS